MNTDTAPHVQMPSLELPIEALVAYVATLEEKCSLYAQLVEQLQGKIKLLEGDGIILGAVQY